MITDLSVRPGESGGAEFFLRGKAAPPAVTRPLRALVCGGRDFCDIELMRAVLGALNLAVVIHGAARGADTMAGQLAAEFGVSTIACPADWRAHGKRAGAIRNREMLLHRPDIVLAFAGGGGTADMVNVAARAGIRTYRILRTSY